MKISERRPGRVRRTFKSCRSSDGIVVRFEIGWSLRSLSVSIAVAPLFVECSELLISDCVRLAVGVLFGAMKFSLDDGVSSLAEGAPH